jgi:hypothetical protein
MSALWMAIGLLASAQPPVTPEALRARYGNVQQLTAEVTQRKEGKYWARPFQSRIRLRYTPERVVWETVSPVRSTVVLEGSTITITGPGGEKRDLRPGDGDPRMAGLVRFIRALLAFDLSGIERDFLLAYGEGSVVATPRPGSELQLFRSIRLRFDDQLDIASLELETDSENTTLTFEHVKRLPASAP